MPLHCDDRACSWDSKKMFRWCGQLYLVWEIDVTSLKKKDEK